MPFYLALGDVGVSDRDALGGVRHACVTVTQTDSMLWAYFSQVKKGCGNRGRQGVLDIAGKAGRQSMMHMSETWQCRK